MISKSCFRSKSLNLSEFIQDIVLISSRLLTSIHLVHSLKLDYQTLGSCCVILKIKTWPFNLLRYLLSTILNILLPFQATLDEYIEPFYLFFIVVQELVQLKIQYFAPKCVILENKMH